MDDTSLAEHLSETHFYLGKHYLNLGGKGAASLLFTLTVADSVYNFVEYYYALLGLVLLGHEQGDLSESGLQ